VASRRGIDVYIHSGSLSRDGKYPGKMRGSDSISPSSPILKEKYSSSISRRPINNAQIFYSSRIIVSDNRGEGRERTYVDDSFRTELRF
jgi:hypothetical protein